VDRYHRAGARDRGALAFDRTLRPQLKRRRYQRAGVPEYWIVDLDGRAVERWRPEDTRPELLAGVLHWAPGDDVHLALDLPGFFAEVWDE
jgi:Uma2 family endonuclease